MTEADVSVELEDDVLTVSGAQGRARGQARMEWAFGSFSRSLTLVGAAA